MVSMTTRFAVSPDVCSSSNDDGSTILHLTSGLLYSLLGTGSQIWTRLSTRPDGLTVDEIVCALRDDFAEVPNDTIRCDVEKLLAQLRQKGIVELRDEGSASLAETSRARLSTIVEFVARQTVDTLLKLKLTSAAAFAVLILVDLTLKAGGFQTLQHLIRCWPISNERQPGEEQVCRAIDRAAMLYVKDALCLQRSAVITCLLRSYGTPAQMVIACRKTPFEGHAWAEVGDRVVNDTQKVRGYYSSVLARW